MRDVPFYPQRWDLSQWKVLGYKDEEDARYWEKSSCAILCLQMAAEFFLDKKFKTSELIAQGVALGAYSDALGWNHKGICELATKLNLSASNGAFNPKALASEVKAGKLALISIKWGFHPTKTRRERLLFWKKYGGHIALVIGTRMNGQKLEGFYVHHTSIREGYNWPSRFIPLSDFKKGYTGRAIVVGKP